MERLTKLTRLTAGREGDRIPVIYENYAVSLCFLVFMNPNIFKNTRFNSYITEYQKELLDRLSRGRNCSKTELVREALHYFLRDNGLDDQLIYDRKDHEKQMAEIFSWCKEREEELDLEALGRGS